MPRAAEHLSFSEWRAFGRLCDAVRVLNRLYCGLDCTDSPLLFPSMAQQRVLQAISDSVLRYDFAVASAWRDGDLSLPDFGGVLYGVDLPAEWIGPDRVSLPAVAGVVDLLSVLPSDLACRYASPDGGLL